LLIVLYFLSEFAGWCGRIYNAFFSFYGKNSQARGLVMAVISHNDIPTGELNIETVAWDNLTWTNVTRPTQKEMDYLAQHFPFHPLDLDDCLSRKQRPKLDEYKDYLFFIFHFSIFNRETRVSTHDQVAVFVGEKYLVTVHSGALKTMVKFFRECQIDEDVRKDNFGQGSGFLIYRILDRAIDAYFPILDKILSWAEDVEDRVFDENIEAAQELAGLRRDVITQRRIMFSSRQVLVELENKLKRFTRMDISVYYGDLMDHANKICDTLDEAKEIIEVYKDTDYILGTDRVNRVMRMLTILSAVILPFVVVSSLWGMNVIFPGGHGISRSPSSFAILIGAMIAVAAGMLLFFRRKRWI
jgi:magnesium transporter